MKFFNRFPMRSVVLTTAAVIALLVVGGLAMSQDGADQTVVATIGADCVSKPAEFTVPEGKTANAFKNLGLEPGSACHDSGAPENKGFVIRDAKNAPVYMWSQYQDQPPYEKGGPLSSLALQSGKYTLSVAGGAGAKITLSYQCK